MQEKQHIKDIMQYESDIWAIADDLIAVSIKQSDFPTYMMPFFALMMLEGRMRNAMQQVIDEECLTPEHNPDDFREAFLERGCGYNDFIVMQGKTLRKICANDTTFEQDFGYYLDGFDADLKRLLGIGRGGDEKFLNMDGIVANLRGKKILLQVVKKWAEIDLAPYSNSDITTLEEHIKRRWADISASTAGEQYTPDDIISLIADIVAAKIDKPHNSFVHIYDPTCGGANLLFGVADRLSRQREYKNIATYGSEYNDALYALAAIESRFREKSRISYGNTLTKIPFHNIPFDVIVANPPYGTKWSGYEREIRNDQTGQFEGGLPAVNDGQLLFMQHILWQLDSKGIAVEVHNGSTLFSGDAGGGESNIRKYVFDRDWVEAIIQMPQNEFFNTGIFTYLWIMNKNKPEERRNRVALIDGSKGWTLLKKSKGDKRREMRSEHRKAIVDTLMNFEPSDICKIYNREYFYYNKQYLTLTEVSNEGKYVAQTVCKDDESFVVKEPVSLRIGEEVYGDLSALSADEIRAMAKRVTEERMELPVSIETESNGVFSFDPSKCTILHTKANGKTEDLGCGAFAFKASVSKKKGVICKISIEPYTTNDYEIIPHHFDAVENQREILRFMQKYVSKPYVLGRNVVGVELNFNKEFYVPEKLESVDDILHEIDALEQKMESVKFDLKI